MILKNAPTSLRGALSRWLIEPEAGVFVGNPSARVRENLWTLATARIKQGTLLMAWTARCPQGYELRGHNLTERTLRDFEGLTLVQFRTDRGVMQALKRIRGPRSKRPDKASLPGPQP